MSKGKVGLNIHLQIRYFLFHSPVGGGIVVNIYNTYYAMYALYLDLHLIDSEG